MQAAFFIFFSKKITFAQSAQIPCSVNNYIHFREHGHQIKAMQLPSTLSFCFFNLCIFVIFVTLKLIT